MPVDKLEWRQCLTLTARLDGTNKIQSRSQGKRPQLLTQLMSYCHTTKTMVLFSLSLQSEENPEHLKEVHCFQAHTLFAAFQGQH